MFILTLSDAVSKLVSIFAINVGFICAYVVSKVMLKICVQTICLILNFHSSACF